MGVAGMYNDPGYAGDRTAAGGAYHRMRERYEFDARHALDSIIQMSMEEPTERTKRASKGNWAAKIDPKVVRGAISDKESRRLAREAIEKIAKIGKTALSSREQLNTIMLGSASPEKKAKLDAEWRKKMKPIFKEAHRSGKFKSAEDRAAYAAYSARDQLNSIIQLNEEAGERSSLEGLAICFRRMQLFAHNAHNLATGKTFIQDHGFLSELYAAYTDAYDDLVERMIGLGQSADLSSIQQQAAASIPTGSPFPTLLGMEKEVTAEIEEKIKEGCTQGTINLLAGLADASEVRHYKLGQILKGSAVKLSAREELESIVRFGVDANGKLHNSKGEFGGDNDAVAHPTAMRMTYGKALGIAATTGTAGGIAGVSAKALVEKLKGLKRK